MERAEVPGGFCLRDKGNVLTLTRPRPHIDLLRGEGHATTAFVDAILRQRDEIVGECGRIAIYDDLEKVTGYESHVRTRLTTWSSAHSRQIEAFHILTGSRLVAMGVTVANIALGGHIVVHLKREAFEQAVREAIHKG